VYVIVAGGGEVGFYLAREFIAEGHEVLVLEPDAKLRERLEEELGEVSLGGEGCRIQCLDQAGVSRADVFIAVTGADEDNLAACQLAKLKYRVPRVVAMLNNPRNKNIFRKLGIEYTVDVAALVIENLKARIPVFPLVHVLSLEDEDTDVVQIRVTETSTCAGKRLGETALSFLAESASLVRAGNGPQMVGASTELQVGDSLISVIPHQLLDKVRAAVAESEKLES